MVDKININGTTTSGNTTYPVTVLVDGSPEELYPGMNVSARVIVEEAGNVLSLPVEAVERGNTVLVALPGCLDEDGSIADITATESRQVTLGPQRRQLHRDPGRPGGGRRGAGPQPPGLQPDERNGDGVSHGTPH